MCHVGKHYKEYEFRIGRTMSLETVWRSFTQQYEPQGQKEVSLCVSLCMCWGASRVHAFQGNMLPKINPCNQE